MFRDALTLGRKYLLSLGGEGLQSGFHFILNLLLIRELSAYDYGLFAIVFVLGGIALTYGSALVSVPANVHIARVKSPGSVNFQDVAFGSVALAICALTTLLVAAGLWLTIDRPGESVAGGLFVGLWMLRNHVRNVMFARQKMSTATLSDCAYTATGVVLIAAIFRSDPDPQTPTVLGALAFANAVGIGVALAMLRRPLRISFRRGVRRLYGAAWADVGWSMVWVTTYNIQGQGLMFLVAALAGPAAYAPIAACLILYRPLRTAVGAFSNVVRPDFAAGLANGRYRRVRLILFGSVGSIVLASGAYGICIWLSWPFLSALIFGSKFAHISLPLVATLAWLNALVSLSYHVPLSLVQAAREFRAVAFSSMFGGFVGMVMVTVVLKLYGVAWSLAGATAGEVVALIYLWGVSLRILAQWPPAPREEPLRAAALRRIAPARELLP